MKVINVGGPIFKLSVAFSSFFLLLLIPSLWLKYIYRYDLGNYGLRFPEFNKENIKLWLKYTLLLLPPLFIMALNHNFQTYYKETLSGGAVSVVTLLISSFIYYLSEEFLFRGLFLFSCIKKIDEKYSIYLTSIVFALLHIQKPVFEVLFSFILGLILCRLVIKTRSILPGTVLHFTLALVLNVLVFYF
jgi:membrane protease YdiL (CAAX protease family)